MWNGTTHRPSPSEGGHSDFAPRNDWEVGLLRYLSKRFGHVSYERILSGDGFFHMYEFVRSEGLLKPAESVVRAMECAPDRKPVISQAGCAGAVPVGDLIGLLKNSGFVNVVHTGMTGVSTSDTTTGATFTAGKSSKL